MHYKKKKKTERERELNLSRNISRTRRNRNSIKVWNFSDKIFLAAYRQNEITRKYIYYNYPTCCFVRDFVAAYATRRGPRAQSIDCRRCAPSENRRARYGAAFYRVLSKSHVSKINECLHCLLVCARKCSSRHWVGTQVRMHSSARRRRRSERDRIGGIHAIPILCTPAIVYRSRQLISPRNGSALEFHSRRNLHRRGALSRSYRLRDLYMRLLRARRDRAPVRRWRSWKIDKEIAIVISAVGAIPYDDLYVFSAERQLVVGRKTMRRKAALPPDDGCLVRIASVAICMQH